MLDALRFAQLGRKFYLRSEQPTLERLGLIAEHDACQVDVLVRRRHAPVPCTGHERERRLASRGAVRQRGMAQIVERPDVVSDPDRLQRLAELGGEPVVVDFRAALRMAEDELVAALVRRAAEVLDERGDPARS